MIPKTDGDATPLGQRPLSVLPIVYRIWASARMGQLVVGSSLVCLIRSSVLGVVLVRFEAWYTSALDIEEVPFWCC